MGYDGWFQPPTGPAFSADQAPKHYYWPFSLDNGLPGGFTSSSRGVGATAGILEFPVTTFIMSDASKTGGLDYNLWIKVAGNSTTFVETLKSNFQNHYTGNRSPFAVGMHSDNYSVTNTGVDGAYQNTAADRRAAVVQFLDYLKDFPEVRIVSFRTVVEWMQNPQKL